MTERDKHLEQVRDLTWFIELINQGFEYLAQVCGYTDAQPGKMDHSLDQLEPMPHERIAGLMSLGMLPDEE